MTIAGRWYFRLGYASASKPLDKTSLYLHLFNRRDPVEEVGGLLSSPAARYSVSPCQRSALLVAAGTAITPRRLPHFLKTTKTVARQSCSHFSLPRRTDLCVLQSLRCAVLKTCAALQIRVLIILSFPSFPFFSVLALLSPPPPGVPYWTIDFRVSARTLTHLLLVQHLNTVRSTSEGLRSSSTRLQS